VVGEERRRISYKFVIPGVGTAVRNRRFNLPVSGYRRGDRIASVEEQPLILTCGSETSFFVSREDRAVQVI